MDIISPASFGNHDDWLLYVREKIPYSEQPYALAYGRLELFRSFYQVRERVFPTEFARELERIQALRDPERTAYLEALNGRIFGRLTEFLRDQAHPKSAEADEIISTSKRQEIQQLVDHLAKKNPYFALWSDYKNGVAGTSGTPDWEDYLCHKLSSESDGDITFARMMSELDKLLLHFYEKELPLPKYSFERARFLHYLRDPERMLQTRAVLHMLAAEIGACTSA